MLGNDFDTPQTIEQTVEFAINSRFTLAFFHIFMPYPGTRIYDTMKKEDRLLFNQQWWLAPDFRYNNATFIPKHMSPDGLSEAAVRANRRFYSLRSIGKRFLDHKTNARTLFSMATYFKFNFLLRHTST
jgi:radical SAM superfamily enzyme YgiQ (UPF0313 family)